MTSTFNPQPRALSPAVADLLLVRCMRSFICAGVITCCALTRTIAGADLSLTVREFKFPFLPPEPRAFIRFSGGEVLLPVEGSNFHFVPDAAQKIAAISYH